MDTVIEKFPDERAARPDPHFQFSVSEVFDDYVANNMPTHLIYVPTRHVLSRAELGRIFQPDNIADGEIVEHMQTHECTRPVAMKAIVRALLKYAILSHRWLREGEPTYGDVLRGVAWTGPGYEKLLEFCRTAEDYGCQLAWSDTCCINKESSTELDEAVRSMFRWYRDAHICIVHLSAVSSLEDLHQDAWFTRGWTLQELLAPRAIRFYGRGWTPLGVVHGGNDKDDDRFAAVLSAATEIPVDDLRNFTPGTARVQEKMVWASKRRTTRVEDVAYSLIGIFDVSMQIAYGEGDWAFHRLMEVIIRRCDEWEIFAWAGPPSTHSSSNAIPKSPRCYYNVDFINSKLEHDGLQRGGKAFALTQRGLQINLSIAEGEMALRFDGTFSFQASPRSSQMPPPFSVVDGHTSWKGERNGKWAIGIVNYQSAVRADGREMSILSPQKEYLCFLLTEQNGSWRKVTTSNILTIRALFNGRARGPVYTVWL
ncbi:hypothetical protein F5I97DRAFT_347319 [Phlebopus sp. FC_14]|nr:hypothetical protein F5I97DRAFT_347319 [Phlebopus sp. FC_14]